jgi:hypothetical protein
MILPKDSLKVWLNGETRRAVIELPVIEKVNEFELVLAGGLRLSYDLAHGAWTLA